LNLTVNSFFQKKVNFTRTFFSKYINYLHKTWISMLALEGCFQDLASLINTHNPSVLATYLILGVDSRILGILLKIQRLRSRPFKNNTLILTLAQSLFLENKIVCPQTE
jgi:hypothetical protein